MREFEDYLKENKKRFEADQLDESIWQGIESQIVVKHKVSYKKLICLLVALIAILLVSFIGYKNSVKAEALENRVIAQFDLGQYNFVQQVNYKKQKLAEESIPVDQLERVQILLQQLEFMDGQFQDYTYYIEKNGYQKFIGEQILNFYTSKIELLDKIQDEIEKINYYEEKIQTSTPKVNIQI